MPQELQQDPEGTLHVLPPQGSGTSCPAWRAGLRGGRRCSSQPKGLPGHGQASLPPSSFGMPSWPTLDATLPWQDSLGCLSLPCQGCCQRPPTHFRCSSERHPGRPAAAQLGRRSLGQRGGCQLGWEWECCRQEPCRANRPRLLGRVSLAASCGKGRRQDFVHEDPVLGKPISSPW